MNAAIETEKPEVTRFENVTIYREAMFGFVRVEAKRVEISKGPYAQWREAVHVRFVEKGKRATRGFMHAGGDGGFVILKGWGHPEEFAPTFDERDDDSRITRHSSYSPEWASEFKAALAGYIARESTSIREVLMDNMERTV